MISWFVQFSHNCPAWQKRSDFEILSRIYLKTYCYFKLNITLLSFLNSIRINLYKICSYKNFLCCDNSWYFYDIIDIYDVFSSLTRLFRFISIFCLCSYLWRIYVYDSLDIFHAFILHIWCIFNRMLIIVWY